MNLTFDGARIGRGVRFLAIPLVCASLAACATTTGPKKKVRSKEYFAESAYGVKASPRVVEEGQPVPKGGGRYQVGKPYKVRETWYKPKEDQNYDKVGYASWYGSAFHGRRTANGEVYDKYHLSAAHPTFPLPSYARVTNLENGTSVIVRVNDRGPYERGRLIDVSSKTADMLDLKRHGTAKVRVQYVGKARMDGLDMPYLMASYTTKGSRVPAVDPGGQIASGVMVASAEPMSMDMQRVAADAYASGARESGATAALDQAVPAVTPLSGPQTFAALPEIGPMPKERPSYIPVPSSSESYASAYSDAPERKSAEAFDAILHLDGSLTPLSALTENAG
ncbi:septal ring lytic transglycosylase RlpA family protein [Sinorhizobium sp. BG8]|uniref:septal ring lytic transglycosylase RlpA family protein n=1 Tax=Sinorhizobium sp. BG8 TaxID=2613773 RepID=UPI00193CAE07|nr:septal ring lytic transglycosylase RlpA family protein [Sinorhizobium sp. BG8]QRM55499.1 septal ring lytic transglycosylase RlpA family protein [Sinorhizobium sp. BG8]